MQIALIGNCQIGPLRPMLECLSPGLDCAALPAVHMIKAEHEELVTTDMAQADWIFTQPISDAYPVEFIRTTEIRKTHGAKVVTFPNCFFEAYAPEWHTLNDSRNMNFRGPLLDYHSSKILFAFFKGYSRFETVQFISQPSKFDEKYYDRSIELSLQSLQKREGELNVKISDIIEKDCRSSRLFNVVNHPVNRLLGVLAERLMTLIGEKTRSVEHSLLTDFDLVASWHPENPFVREQEKMTFRQIDLYRGVRLRPSGNRLGFEPAGAKIYDHASIVDRFFDFYEFNRQALILHPRISKVLGFAF